MFIKKILLVGMGLFVSVLHSQITLIPDPEFENYLINIGVDTDGTLNGQVFTADIEDKIELQFPWGAPDITDLTGIEDFASLELLHILSLNITELNLSNNLNLKRLSIYDTSLESLDVSNNTELESLRITLNSGGGLFTSSINSLDLSNNSLLRRCDMSGFYITTLNLSQNIDLENLDIDNMDELTSVNLKNGNNTDIVFVRLIENIALECIQVDDPASVIVGISPPYDNWIIENDPIITDDCNLSISENVLQQIITVYPNPISSILVLENNSNILIDSITIYDLKGRLIHQEDDDLTHIDVSHLMKGLYLIDIKTEKGNVVKKIVKK